MPSPTSSDEPADVPEPRYFAAMGAARLLLAGILAAGLVVTGCRRKSDSTVTLSTDAGPGASRRDEPPVALDAETPVRYPMALYQQRISGVQPMVSRTDS
jgi:hypothetical protein